MKSKTNHIETINREMGEVKTEIEWMKTQMIDLKDYIKKVSDRTWWILSGVILTVLIEILNAM